MILNQGDDSATSIPAASMFVIGVAVVINGNIHQDLKVVNE
jgi:hypothetical protein